LRQLNQAVIEKNLLIFSNLIFLWRVSIYDSRTCYTYYKTSDGAVSEV